MRWKLLCVSMHDIRYMYACYKIGVSTHITSIGSKLFKLLNNVKVIFVQRVHLTGIWTENKKSMNRKLC